MINTQSSTSKDSDVTLYHKIILNKMLDKSAIIFVKVGMTQS